RDRGPQGQRRIDRVPPDQQVELLQLEQGAVSAAAGVAEGEVHADVPRGEREIGILEGGVVYLEVERERGEGAVAVLALDRAFDREGSRRLHLREVMGVDRRHEGEDTAEIRGGGA